MAWSALQAVFVWMVTHAALPVLVMRTWTVSPALAHPLVGSGAVLGAHGRSGRRTHHLLSLEVATPMVRRHSTQQTSVCTIGVRLRSTDANSHRCHGGTAIAYN